MAAVAAASSMARGPSSRKLLAVSYIIHLSIIIAKSFEHEFINHYMDLRHHQFPSSLLSEIKAHFLEKHKFSSN